MQLDGAQLMRAWSAQWPSRSSALLLLLVLLLPCVICATSEQELLELSCASDAHCAQFQLAGTARARCVEGSCHCTAWSGEQRLACRPREQKLSNIIGGRCPCSQAHAECDDRLQQCYCAASYAPSPDRRRCLALSVPLNEACELDGQCQEADPFAECHAQQRRCLCQDEFEAHDGKCLHVLRNNFSCVSAKDCLQFGADSLCLPQLHKCGCAAGHVRTRDMGNCRPGLAYQSGCDTNAACQVRLGAAATCRLGRCSCQPQFYASERAESEQHIVCQPIVVFGSYCRNDSHCEQQPLGGGPQTMTCRLGECHCRANHRTLDSVLCVPASDGNRCGLALLLWGSVLCLLQLQ